MYSLSDEQIDYILSDIRRNGVETEDLQFNLLDHICCIIEQNLEATGDFEDFYRQTIKQFYKTELREIEEETTLLLTFKNYYAMKKTMIASGAFSAITFVLGSFFKAMYWPGASVLLVLGIGSFSLVFLPLLFLLKTKETSGQRDKVLLFVGTITSILYSLSVLFQVQHWNGAKMMWLATLAISAFILIPMFFWGGIRRPETRVNTFISSLLLLGFVGLQFTLTGLRPPMQNTARIYTYLQDEQLLQKLQAARPVTNTAEQDIQAICNKMKTLLLQHDIGVKEMPKDFETRNIPILEREFNRSAFVNGEGLALIQQLRDKVKTYNDEHSNDAAAQLPVTHTILDPEFANKNYCTNLFVLNNITQIQLFLATNENKAVALN